MFATYTSDIKKSTSNTTKVSSSTNCVFLPLAVADEIFSKSFVEKIKSKVDLFEQQRNQLDHLSKNELQLDIGDTCINNKSKILLSLESYSSYEELWNTEHSSNDIPVKLVIKYSIPLNQDYIIPESFSRKRNQSQKNIELESLLNYTYVKLPINSYFDIIESGEYTLFKNNINV